MRMRTNYALSVQVTFDPLSLKSLSPNNIIFEYGRPTFVFVGGVASGSELVQRGSGWETAYSKETDKTFA